MNVIYLTTLWTVTTLQSANGAKRIPNTAGPWDVWIERFSMCSDDDKRVQMKFSHYNPNKKFEPQVWTGLMNVTHEFTDDWWANAILDVRNNNQWKENAFIFKFPKRGCSAARDYPPPDFYEYFSVKGTPCLVKQVCSIGQ
ncbi:uncharacterized protein LOC113211198 [Frankliniella occidentalis]|uniref:Uncharacterized protein LOC113211198 n=1 Tax=Frankliniella occidentalis TaxID=133901 RepID=A0A9C6XR42_FRAOC|nr:uncharacterized protein LOC113211198 [Frankliniella occidentalis]